jgi:hypothetical protein
MILIFYLCPATAVADAMLSIQSYMQGLAGELVNVLREAGQVVPPALMKFGTHVKKKVCGLNLFSEVSLLFICMVHLYPYVCEYLGVHVQQYL